MDMRLANLEGRDPESVLAREGTPRTFLDAAQAIIERKQKGWKLDKTQFRWHRGLLVHAKPIHNKSVNHIATGDIEAILRPIWHSRNYSARGFRGYIEQALDLATVLGWREGDNPARWSGNLEYLLPNHKPEVKHVPAMPFADAPAPTESER